MTTPRAALAALLATVHDITDKRANALPRTASDHAIVRLQAACETRDWNAANEAAADLCEALDDTEQALHAAATRVEQAERALAAAEPTLTITAYKNSCDVSCDAGAFAIPHASVEAFVAVAEALGARVVRR